MIGDILKKVESPLNDELICDLIRRYIECDFDDNKLYASVNELENDDGKDQSKYSDKLYEYVGNNSKMANFAYAGMKNDLYFYRDSNPSWVILRTSLDRVQSNRNADGKIAPIYRFYLNLTGKEKYDFVTSYMAYCKENNLPTTFKFSLGDKRLDQIIIQTRIENFEENLGVIENLSEDKHLGKLPMLVGKYEDNIGITEEYYENFHSPTQVRLMLVKTAMTKYLCDHYEEIPKDSPNEAIETIGYMIEDFEDRVEYELKYKERHAGGHDKYYQKKSTVDCNKEHIQSVSHYDYMPWKDVGISEVIKEIYEQEPDAFLNEITSNYRTIATEAWGFSKNLIFSIDTEQMFLEDKTESLTANSIGEYLSENARSKDEEKALEALTVTKEEQVK